MRTFPQRLGFTLVEILVVVVVLGILAGVVGASVFGFVEDARRATFISNIRSFTQAADVFRQETGYYLEDSSTGELPFGFDAYVDPQDWVGGTPLGGEWDAEFESFGVTSAIGVHFQSGPQRDDDYMVGVDMLFDDGDLDAGIFRKIASDRYYAIIEE